MWRLRWVRFSLMMMAAGILQASCRAASWFPLGPFGGDVRSLAADPADPSHHLFLGTATGWVYDSHDGGVKWTRVAQINGRNDLAVDHILVDKDNPKRLVVGAWVIGKSTDGGIFISEDYGKNWYSQAQMRGQSVRSLARSVSNPKELVAGTLAGVFRSQDNGVHWTQISPSGSTEIHEIESVAIDPVDPNVVYVGTWHLPWKTTDGGVSWHNIKEGLIDDSDVFSIIVDPQNPKVVYASACSGIYKSSDSGDLFHKVQGIPSTARRTRKLAQDPEQLNTVFAGTTEGLYRSLDAGVHWDRMTPSSVIVNDVFVDPNDSKRVVLATERGGVYRSEDGGTSFESSNDGFSARQVSAYAQDAANPNTLFVGVVNDKATGGVFESTDGAVHWTQRSDGLEGRDVFSLLSLPEGDLLAGTAHGIFRLANGVWTDSSAMVAPAPKQAARKAVPATAMPVGFAVRRKRDAAADFRVKSHAGTRSSRHFSGFPASARFAAVSFNVGRGKVTHVSEMKVKHVPVAAHQINGAKEAEDTKGTRSNKGVKDTKGTKGGTKGTRGQIGHGVVRKAGAAKAAGTRNNTARVGKHVQVAARGSQGASHVVLRKVAAKHPASAQPSSAARAGISPIEAETRLAEMRADHEGASGSVASTIFAMARTNRTVFAGTSDGLLQSDDEGRRWSAVPISPLPTVHFLAVRSSVGAGGQGSDGPAKLLAADLGKAAMSADGGQSWQPVPLPTGLTQVGAVGLDGEGNLWIGGREGVWFSDNAGQEWKSLRNLFLTQVDSLYYDAAGQRMLVTAATSTSVFSVEAKTQRVTYTNTGWRLRFVRPVGSYLVAGTLFDGMVVQPEMVATPLSTEQPAK